MEGGNGVGFVLSGGLGPRRRLGIINERKEGSKRGSQ
jgi:hypothetical protein